MHGEVSGRLNNRKSGWQYLEVKVCILHKTTKTFEAQKEWSDAKATVKTRNLDNMNPYSRMNKSRQQLGRKTSR